MAWTATNPVEIGEDTKKSEWDTLWNNCVFTYIEPGTVMLFGQSSAPTGWTKKTDWTDNSMLVYTSGVIGAGAGSDDLVAGWTTAIPSPTGEESAHTHNMAHTHTVPNGTDIASGSSGAAYDGPSTAITGAGSAHSHAVTQDTFSPKYRKVIAAEKDSGSWTAANPVSNIGEAMKESAHWDVLWTNIDFNYLPAGTILLFGQSSAPTGWTKKTDWTDNSMLVYTSGAVGEGGSDDPTSWTTAVATQDESAHTHSLQAHTHDLISDSQTVDADPPYGDYGTTTGGPSPVSTEAGSAHGHSVSQDTFSPKYQSVIAATKDSGDWTGTDPVALYDPTKKSQYDKAWDNVSFNYFAAGTIMLFGQSAAPTGWTKKENWVDGSMLVFTTGNIGSGGADDPTSWTTAIAIDNESSHTHGLNDHVHVLGAGVVVPTGGSRSDNTSAATGNTGSGSAHNHSTGQDTVTPLYQKIISATKDA